MTNGAVSESLISLVVDAAGVVGAIVALPTAFFVFGKYRLYIEVCGKAGDSVDSPVGCAWVTLVNHGREAAIQQISVSYRGDYPAALKDDLSPYWSVEPEAPCVLQQGRRLEARIPVPFHDIGDTCEWSVVVELEDTRKLIISSENIWYQRKLFYRPVLLGLTGPLRPRKGWLWRIERWKQDRSTKREIRGIKAGDSAVK